MLPSKKAEQICRSSDGGGHPQLTEQSAFTLQKDRLGSFPGSEFKDSAEREELKQNKVNTESETSVNFKFEPPGGRAVL